MKTQQKHLLLSFLRLGMTLVILAGLLAVQPLTPARAVESALAGYWKLDGNATDSSNYSHNGTLTGGSWSASHAPTGFINTGALSLTGADGQGVTMSLVTTATNNLSISAWVNWAGTNGRPQVIFYNGHSATSGYGIYLSSTGELNILNGSIGFATSTFVLTPGIWQYVVATRDAGTWKLYVNGTQIPLTGNPAPLVPTGGTAIGRAPTNTTEIFNGLIDDARIYTRVLTAAEITPDPTAPFVTFGTGSVPPSSGATLTVGPTQLLVRFSENVRGDGSEYSANSAWNYMLVRPGPNGVFDTLVTSSAICDSDHVQEGDDVRIEIDTITYDPATFTATLTIYSAYAPLATGTYRLYLCGAASIWDPHGNPLNGGINSAVNFTVGAGAPAALPATGFAPDRVTALPRQAESYAGLGDLWLEIPRLGVQMNIVGVPQSGNTWDVSWLGNQAGWLQGTAFPTWNGNSVITGHVWNADNSAGPFVYLNTLWYGDRIIVHAWGQQYVYEVRGVTQVRPDSTVAAFQHKDTPWLTLTTCRSWDADKGTYRYRVLVQAALVSIK
jgi:LPXTG-site transpeptidase (sortase) family protein